MTNNVFKKSLVIGIIILFLGASIIPFVTSKETLKTSTFNSTGFTDNCDWIVDNEGDGDFTNIQDAIDFAIPGQTICVYSGTYFENIEINKQIKLKGYNYELGSGNNTGKPIINASFNSHTLIIYSGGNFTSITGFEITGSGTEYKWVNDSSGSRKRYIYAGIEIVYAMECSIFDNTIHDNGCGIDCNTEKFVYIENNIISNNYDDGIRGFENLRIIDNYIHHNGIHENFNQGDGIELWTGAVGSYIYNNTIEYNFIDGIWADTPNKVNIIINIINSNGFCGVHMYGSIGSKIEGNTIQNNGIYFKEREFASGIFLQTCNGGSIFKNNIIYNYNGVSLFNCINIHVYENENISYSQKFPQIPPLNGYGIHIKDTKGGNRISNNNIIFNENDGIGVENSDYNIIRDNIVKSNKIAGIHLSHTNWNCIINCTLEYNTYSGFACIFAFCDCIHESRIRNNGVYSINAWFSLIFAQNNTWEGVPNFPYSIVIWNGPYTYNKPSLKPIIIKSNRHLIGNVQKIGKVIGINIDEGKELLQQFQVLKYYSAMSRRIEKYDLS